MYIFVFWAITVSASEFALRGELLLCVSSDHWELGNSGAASASATVPTSICTSFEDSHGLHAVYTSSKKLKT